MKPGIDMDLITEVINNRPEGIKLEEKKAWWKLEGPQGHRIYVAKQKVCRQIDLSEFGEGEPGTLKPAVHNGRVQAHLDLGDPRALENLQDLMVKMLSLPRVEHKRQGPLAGAARPKGFETKVDAKASPVDSLSDEQKAERLRRIREYAARTGGTVSPTTLAALAPSSSPEPEAQASEDGGEEMAAAAAE